MTKWNNSYRVLRKNVDTKTSSNKNTLLRHIIRTIKRHCQRNLPPILYFLKIIQGDSPANGEAEPTQIIKTWVILL